MFEFLSGGKNKFIGIDFGTSSIKVVVISYRNQRMYLDDYGIVELNLETQGNQRQLVKNRPFEQKLNIALKNLLEKMKITTGQAYVSLPGFSGLITVIDLPEMKDEELNRAIQFEAHKYIPSSLDEVAMSWEIVGNKKIINKGEKSIVPTTTVEKNKNIKVLLVAAPKREIERYDRLVGGTQLAVQAIEIETFPIARALINEDSGTFLIIDMGSRATNMILVDNGIVCVNRTIDAGGSEITIAVSDSMNISKVRAESFKRGEKDLLNGGDTPIVVPVLELIISESRRIIDAYMEKNKEASVKKVVLSGGTSKMKGLSEYFSKKLALPTTLGNPWKAINIDPIAAPLIEEIGSSFTVAVGLAMRGVDDYKRK
jgi:type IV pilus assembly protein PilM